MTTHIAVLGAGSWGTALALLLSRNGHHVMLWGKDEAALAQMACLFLKRFIVLPI